MSPDLQPRIRLEVFSAERMHINAFMQVARIFLNPLSPTDYSPGHDPGNLNTAQLKMPAVEQRLKLESVATPY
jgi:hypothetical protein